MKSHTVGIFLVSVIAIFCSSLITITYGRTTASPNAVNQSTEGNSTAGNEVLQGIQDDSNNTSNNRTIPTSTRKPDKDDDDDDDLDDDDIFQKFFGGLKAEYVAMIGMGALIVLLFITTMVIICTLGGRRKSKS